MSNNNDKIKTLWILNDVERFPWISMRSRRVDNEDLKRAVECVNAMAGIESPQKLRETWEAVKSLELDAYYVMKAQRDELLETVKFCKSVIESNGVFERSEELAVSKCEVAIDTIKEYDLVKK